MGKFKVGDRVRFVQKYGHANEGDEATVTGFWGGDDGVSVDVHNGKGPHSCLMSRVELVPAWQPKVGDRVRFVRDSTAGGARYGAEGEIATVVSSAREIPDGRYALDVKLDNDRIGFSPAAYLDDLEPLPVAAEAQPAPLTIEAGRCYRTRDGRKVGPIARGRMVSDAWYWEAPSVDLEYECAWYQNGSFFSGEEHKMDIIAEWVDEPVAVAASNDNAAPAKFKVGDKFNYAYTTDSWQNLTVARISWHDGIPNYHAIDPVRGEGAFSEQMMAPITPSAIVALIEDGQPKPATRPKIHPDQASATAEAERLALTHPGQEFGVFVLADSKIADEVITKTAVLRAA